MLYKYCKPDGFDILTNYRLKLKKFDDFNDPFELVFGIDEDTALSNIKKEYEEKPDIIIEWQHILDDQNISYDKALPEDIMEKFTKFQIKDFERVKNEIRKEQNETIGIVCFSELPDVIQMWAHYTDDHKGIVVGIEESEFLEDTRNLVKVCYPDKMVLLRVTGIAERFDRYATECILEVIHSKETNWGYEKEIRTYITLDEAEKDGDCYFKKIPASAIKEIYLGLRSDKTAKVTAECIKKREEYKHLKIYKMEKHKSAYKLVPEEIT